MLLRQSASIVSGPLELAEVPDPEPRLHEVRIRVHACGVCRTDLHIIEQELPLSYRPLIPGHQIIGTIDRLGPGAGRHLQLGDRVGIAWLRHTCGECRFCLSGRENLCAEARFTGYHANGGYAEYAVVHEDYAYRIDAALDDEQAAPLLCAGIIGYRALERCDVPPGGTLGIYGFGSSAHLVMQLARQRGHAVYVISRNEAHRALAQSLGAVWTGTHAEQLPTALDSAILFAPVGELVPPALEHLQPGGTLVLAGIYLTDLPPLDYERHLFHERNLRSVTANTRSDGVHFLAEAAQIPIRCQVTRYHLEQANEALLDLKQDALRGSAVLTLGT